MSRSTRFVQGLGLGIVRQALMLIVGLAMTALLLTRLGESQLGLWYVAGTLLGYLGVTELGVAAMLPREVGHALGRGGRRDFVEVRAMTTQALSITIVQLPVIALCTVGVLGLAPTADDALRWPLLLAASVYILLYPARLAQATLTGLQDLAFLELAALASWALGTAAVVALVLAGVGLFSVATGWALTQAALALSCLIRLRRRFPEAWPRVPRAPGWGLIRSWVGRSAWLTVSQVAMMLRNGTDLVIIGKLLGAATAVPYVSTGKLVVVLGVFPPMVLASAQPALAELRFAADRARLARVTDALMSVTLMFSGASACAILAMTQPFVTAWLGPEQFAGPALVAIMVANMVMRHASNSMSNTLFCLGHERSLAIVAILDGALTLGVMVVLTPVLGLHGAALGPLVGITVVSIPYGMWKLGRESQRGIFASIRPLRSWALSFATTALTTVAAVRWLEPKGFIGAVAAGAMTTSVYALLTWRRLLAPPVSDYVRPALERAAKHLGIGATGL